MRYQKVNRKNDRPNAPFIRSFGYIVNGLAFNGLLIFILRFPQYRDVTDFIGAIVYVVIFGGFATFMFRVAYKMRKW